MLKEDWGCESNLEKKSHSVSGFVVGQTKAIGLQQPTLI